MRVQYAEFHFLKYTFAFIPVGVEIFQGRKYVLWNVIFEYKGQFFETFYFAFVPSAKICRNVLKNRKYKLI